MKVKDLTILIGIIGIVLMMVIPIPVGLLDVLLIVNISAGAYDFAYRHEYARMRYNSPYFPSFCLSRRYSG